MRRSIRLAVPAIAAATFLLTGCGSDDEEGGSPFGGGSGEENAQEGGAASGETGGEEAPADEGGSGGGAAPTNEELEGFWTETAGGDDSTLTITAGEAQYMENIEEEGDLCTGSVSDGTLTVECLQLGSALFPDTEAALTLDGTTLTVAWASGTTETFESLAGDLGDLGDMGSLEGLETPDMSELEDLQQELEDLGY
ncbi:hypothetical protein [Streptomyces litchfieldiae]|uniref:Lipoprotein n=1 Tax=Streptomyces litchfieldiae TaxID=3075543 RepID=A0ABU2MZL3_9ACTN|nr:hypothetical protein [Streptomyces sp. DSM 44938]MDT0346708.1 hypothetical protein [Streptomyces sp. DSM 44938]